MNKWSPALSGSDAESALRTIDRIVDDLVVHPVGNVFTLGRGDAGIGLALAVVARDFQREDLVDPALARLDGAIEQATELPSGIGLWTGLAGAAWALELGYRILSEGAEEEEDGDQGSGSDTDVDEEDPLDAIDELLATVVAEAGKSMHFELFTGLCGVGVYALERIRRPSARRLLEAVCRSLIDASSVQTDGRAWFTGPDIIGDDIALFPDGYFSLGPAHGNPGPLAVLALASAHGVGDPAALSDAVSAGLSWLWRQRFVGRPWGLFAALAGGNHPHRAGWCYGDPGVACAMGVALEGPGVADVWEKHTRELLGAVVARPVEECGLEDPTLCHGAFGYAHMLNRLGQRWKSDEALELARKWYRRGLEMQVDDRGIGGFVTVERSDETGEFEEMSFAGVLDGAAGIALALSAAVSENEPEWDRAFLMSSQSH